MSEINIPRAEQEALRAVQHDVLNQLIDQCLRDERSSALRSLRLDNCGPYVATQVRAFENALDTYGRAKAEKKRAETRYDALSAGRDLANAVLLMQQRMATEEDEGLRFHVDDLIIPPNRFGERLSVRVSYRWRPSVATSWAYGDITIFHDVDVRPTPHCLRRNASRALPDRRRNGRRRCIVNGNISRAWRFIPSATFSRTVATVWRFRKFSR